MRVLIACEYSGRVRDAFIACGFDAVSCDLLDTDVPGPHIKGDVRDVMYSGVWDLLIAHPPCTRLANSGARWLKVPPKSRTLVSMWREFFEGVEFYKAIRDAPIYFKAIENPIMHCHAREALNMDEYRRQIVQPWQFGDPAFKATGFELHNLPDLVSVDALTPPERGTQGYKDWSVIHNEAPGPDRWKNRSTTFPGIAEAMAVQWGTFVSNYLGDIL